MKQGKTLIDLATELQRQQDAKKDLVVPTSQLEMDDRGQLHLPTEIFKTTDHCHGQIAERLGVPKRYYDKMRSEAPQLLATNVNHWFKDQDEERMLRTMDGNARAFLSNRYHRIDNWNVTEAVLQAAHDMKAQGSDIELITCEVTERRLYMNFSFPKLEDAVDVGDPVRMGFSVTNSEIGGGALDVKPELFRLICTNGMVMNAAKNEGRMRRAHLGRRVEMSDNYSIYEDDTLEADDRALMLKIRDTIRSLADQRTFDTIIAKLRAAKEGEQVENPVKAIEVLSQKIGANEKEGTSILQNLLKGDEGLPTDMSRWGVANAVTRLANNVESFDRSHELMELGGKIIDMPRSEWREIAEAA